MKDKKKQWYVFVCATGLFLIICLILFPIGSIIKKDEAYSNTENRTLQERPHLSASAVQSGEFEKQYETYVNDQFPLRNLFVKAKAKVDSLLGKSESNDVYLSSGDYLLEKFIPGTEKNQKETMQAIKEFADKNKKLKQYFMLVPNAINILKDKLPSGAPEIDQNKYMDNFLSEVSKMNIMPVDVRNELIHEKENGIYYKTDHHWTTFGAYQGFKKLCEIMKLDANKVSYDKVTVTNQFKGSLSFKSGFNLGMTELMDIYLPTKNEIHSVVEYVEEKKKTATFYDHKKIGTNNCYELYFDGNHPQITIHNAVDSDRVLLIFKDSYANCFIPFLAPYYKEIVVVDPRYYYDDIEQLISDEEVTDVLFLYNANTFFADGSLKTILKE